MVDGGEESRISQSGMNRKSRCSVSARIMGFSRSLRSSHIWVDRVCVRLSSTTWMLSSSTVGTDKLVNKLFTCVTAVLLSPVQWLAVGRASCRSIKYENCENS